MNFKDLRHQLGKWRKTRYDHRSDNLLLDLVELQWRRSAGAHDVNKYLTLVYQIDLGVTPLLWVERKELSNRFGDSSPSSATTALDSLPPLSSRTDIRAKGLSERSPLLEKIN